MCIIDHYPLGNQRTEISGGLDISEKTWEGQPVLEPGLSDIASSRTTLIMFIVYGHLLNRKQCGKKLRLLK